MTKKKTKFPTALPNIIINMEPLPSLNGAERSILPTQTLLLELLDIIS